MEKNVTEPIQSLTSLLSSTQTAYTAGGSFIVIAKLPFLHRVEHFS